MASDQQAGSGSTDVRAGTGTTPPRSSDSWRAFLAAYIGWVFDYYEFLFLTIVIVPVATAFNWTAAQTSLVLSAQLGALAIGGVLFGYLADRFGRVTMLQISILLFALATLARAFTPNYEYMLLFTVLAGIGIGGEFGIGQSLVTETVGEARRGAWGSMLYSGIFVGIMLASLMGIFVLPAVGWRISFAIAAFPAILAIFVRRLTPESELWEARRDRGENIVPLSGYTSRGFLFPLGLCLITAVLQLFAYYGITSLMPTYLVNTAGFTISQASWWVFFTGVAGLFGATIAAVFNDGLGRRLTLSIAAVVGAVGGLLVYLLWPQLQSVTVILGAFFILYAGFGATASLFGPLFSEMFPTSFRATGVSAALQLARGTTFAAPLLAGALYPVIGYSPLILGAVGLLILLATIAWRFPETAKAEVDF